MIFINCMESHAVYIKKRNTITFYKQFVQTLKMGLDCTLYIPLSLVSAPILPVWVCLLLPVFVYVIVFLWIVKHHFPLMADASKCKFTPSQRTLLLQPCGKIHNTSQRGTPVTVCWGVY